MTIPLPEPVACQWRQHGKVVNAFTHQPGDRSKWDYDGYWLNKGYDKSPLFDADQLRDYGDARAAEEREKIMVELRQALQDDSNVAAIRALAQS